MSIVSCELPSIDKTTRTCIIDGVKFRSVVDVIAATCMCNNDTARQRWKYLKDNIDPFVKNTIERTVVHKFKGVGVDVADPETLAAIILELPGKKASQFRKSAACYLYKCFEPDDEFIDLIDNRLADCVP